MNNVSINKLAPAAFEYFRKLNFDEYGKKETSLSLKDILPLNPKQYDKHRAPKFLGQPTIVYFHVTVLSLDSINEESMVREETDKHYVGKFTFPFIKFLINKIISFISTVNLSLY